MEAKTSYTRVGIIVVMLSAALLAAGLWLSFGFEQIKYNIYAVYMHEPVSGLSEESPVKYNGVQVGSVAKIEISRINPQDVKILLNIAEGTPITTSTYATLISQGITGNAYVGLSASSPDLTPLKKNPEEPYPIIPAKASLFKQLDRVLKEVSENVNSVTERLKEILSPENARNIKKSLHNIENFSEVLAEHNKSIAHILKNSDVMFKNLAAASQDMPAVIRSVRQNFDDLSHQMSEAGHNISVTMTSGKSAIDKFSTQTIPPVIQLIQKLNNIAANLEKVSNQMRQNPSVIIRGTTPPPPGPGE